MRCSIKVAYRDGLSRVERHDPTLSSDDDKAVQLIFADILDSWDRFTAKRTSDTSVNATDRAVRSVNRAFRFSSWAYVRLSAKSFLHRGLFRVHLSITVSDPNKAGDEVVNAARREAAYLAEIVVVRREVAVKDVKEMICFDETDEFFAAALESGVVEKARQASGGGK